MKISLNYLTLIPRCYVTAINTKSMNAPYLFALPWLLLHFNHHESEIGEIPRLDPQPPWMTQWGSFWRRRINSVWMPRKSGCQDLFHSFLGYHHFFSYWLSDFAWLTDWPLRLTETVWHFLSPLFVLLFFVFLSRFLISSLRILSGLFFFLSWPKSHRILTMIP